MRDMSTQINKNDPPANSTVSPSATWERDTANTPVYAVVSAVADVVGADPIDLPPLYEAIDPEALNDLLTSQPDTTVATVAFRYAGYEVTVHGNGEVQVEH